MPLRSVPIEFVRNNRWSKMTNGRIIGRPQEAIMATRSGKIGLFAFDPARCDALSEVLAYRWWAVGLRGIAWAVGGVVILVAARRLLAAGAGPSAPTRDDFLQISPLGSAIATTPGIAQPSDDEDVVLRLVRLLLEHGGDPNHARRDGMTPLHAAAWRGLGRVAHELLDAGADPTLVATAGPHAGETPADSALSQGHLVLASRLDRGAVQVVSPYA